MIAGSDKTCVHPRHGFTPAAISYQQNVHLESGHWDTNCMYQTGSTGWGRGAALLMTGRNKTFGCYHFVGALTRQRGQSEDKETIWTVHQFLGSCRYHMHAIGHCFEDALSCFCLSQMPCLVAIKPTTRRLALVHGRSSLNVIEYVIDTMASI